MGKWLKSPQNTNHWVSSLHLLLQQHSSVAITTNHLKPSLVQLVVRYGVTDESKLKNSQLWRNYTGSMQRQAILASDSPLWKIWASLIDMSKVKLRVNP
eukprot:1106441-Pelagomonas_calceolata.AAC.1